MKIFRISLIIFVILVGLFAFTLWWFFQPVSNSDRERQTFVIARGESVQSIAEKLAEAGLIRHPLAFRLKIKLLKSAWDQNNTSIQAGSFKLAPSMTLDEIIAHLTQGTDDVWLTILEGWRTEEIAQYASQNLKNFDQNKFIDLAKDDEGMLYPDSYLVPAEYSEEQLHRLLLNTFKQKVLDQLSTEIEQSDLSLQELITLASIVEREARVEEQMRHVAGILLNRLEIGMALQVDATLQYARPEPIDNNWWTPPYAADRKIDSPYNTYLHTGLPPGPICNPSLIAIRSVLHPLETDELFYIHATDGSMYYARNAEEHNANINRYLR